MRECFRTLSVCIALAVVIGIVAGCGGSGGGAAAVVAPSGPTGVRADGAWASVMGVRAVAPVVGPALNPGYHDTYLQPERLSVALAKFELMKSADDANPYVVFSATVDNPEVVALTGGGSASFGENTAYPPAGTYTHVRMTMVYMEARFVIDDGWGGGPAPADFRLYASTVGNIKNGDVVSMRNGSLYWMTSPYYRGDESAFQVTTAAGPRPDNLSGTETVDGNLRGRSIVVQDFFFSEPDDVSADPYVQTVALPQPIVVPANPTGQYRIVTNFDVTRSPSDPQATGLFLFDDVNANGIFEPGPPDQGGPTRDFNDGVHGEPMYCILQPAITMSYTQASE